MKKQLSAALLAVSLIVVAPVIANAASTGTNIQKTGVETGLKALQDQDFEAARVAFTAAAGHGDALGHYYLGAMYQRGLGGQRSEVKALENYRKAAEQEIPEAEFAMGLFFQHGKAFLQKDPDKAVAWYSKAASQGSIAARYNLGMMYATGEAVPIAYGSNPDYIKARGWFKITLDGINVDADKTKIEAIVTELETHMTAGQIEKSETFFKEWKTNNK